MRMVLEGDSSPSRIDLPLLKAVARARRWSDDLISGHMGSVDELARRYLAIRPVRLQHKFDWRVGVQIEIDIQKSGQKTFRSELGPHPLLDRVIEAALVERLAGSSPRQQLRPVNIDDDWQPKTLDPREHPSLGRQKPELDRRDRANLHSPYFDRRSDLEPIEVALEHADEPHRPSEHAARADYDQATIKIAKLATTNAPITAGLTRLPMTAY